MWELITLICRSQGTLGLSVIETEVGFEGGREIQPLLLPIINRMKWKIKEDTYVWRAYISFSFAFTYQNIIASDSLLPPKSFKKCLLCAWIVENYSGKGIMAKPNKQNTSKETSKQTIRNKKREREKLLSNQEKRFDRCIFVIIIMSKN